MGRPTRRSGGRAIQDAESLFRQSVEIGEADYTYVALAIGAAPQAPPSWAVLACIELRQEREKATARGNADEIEGILDDIVRYYDREQRAFELTCHGSLNALDEYRPPSLRKAILHVLKANGQRVKQFGGADDDWFIDIRRAWGWEQKHDLAPLSFFHLEEGKLDEEGKINGRNRWLQTTSRIDRVLMRSAALENGDPDDLAKWAWITKALIHNEMFENQRSDQPET